MADPKYLTGEALDAEARGWALRGPGESDDAFRYRLQALIDARKPTERKPSAETMDALAAVKLAAKNAARTAEGVHIELKRAGASGLPFDSGAMDELQAAERALYGAVWAIREIKRL